MREKSIEEKLTKAVQQNEGVCWKFTSPGTAGVPDRLTAQRQTCFRGSESPRRTAPTVATLPAQALAAARLPGLCSGQLGGHRQNHLGGEK